MRSGAVVARVTRKKGGGGSRVKKTEFAHERIESDFEDAPY